MSLCASVCLKKKIIIIIIIIMLYLFYPLPYELSLKIFYYYVGWIYPEELKRDLRHCARFVEIFNKLYEEDRTSLYRHIKSSKVIRRLARCDFFHRILLVHSSPKNFVQSYTQEYPSFLLYEIKTLQNI